MKRVFILMLLFFISCGSKDIDFTYDLDESRIAVSSRLIADRPVTILVSKSIDDLSQSYTFEDLILNDADVYLYKDETYIEKLAYHELKLKYEGIHVVETGSLYSFRISHPDFLDVNTENVQIPESFNVALSSEKKMEDILTECSSTSLYNVYSLNFATEITSISPQQYIRISLDSKGRCKTNWTNGGDCRYLSSGYAIEEGCLNDFIFEYTTTNEFTDTVKYKIERFSHSFGAYSESIDQSLGEENGLIIQDKTYSNVNNGYGLVLSASEHSGIIVLQ